MSWFEKKSKILSIVSEEQTVLNSTTEAIVIKRGFGFILRTVPTDTEVFCAVYDYVGKAALSKGYWNRKRKLGVTMHFSEIIKQLTIFLKSEA